MLEFPGEEGPASDNPIAEGLNRLFQKADDYAGHMFEEEGKEDDEEVRRAEEYIPGTDEEEPEEVFRERRPAASRPPPRICPRRSWPGGTARASSPWGYARCWCSCCFCPPST